MIGSFVSVANAALVAKSGTKKIIPLLWIKSSMKPQMKKNHKTDPPKSGTSYSKNIVVHGPLSMVHGPWTNFGNCTGHGHGHHNVTFLESLRPKQTKYCPFIQLDKNGHKWLWTPQWLMR